MQRRTPSRLFQSDEYRIFTPDFLQANGTILNTNNEDTAEYVVFFKKRTKSRRQDVTYIRQKSTMIKKAAITGHLEHINFFTIDPPPLSRQNISPKIKTEEEEEEKINFFYLLPREIVFRVLCYLPLSGVVSVAKTCLSCRLIAYDNLLWKNLCYKTWNNPDFMFPDLAPYKQSIRTWYNWNSKERLNSIQVLEIFQSNIWRLLYIALYDFETMPSITHFTELFRKTSECYPTTRVVKYTCSLGNFILKGINKSSFVEHMVFGNTAKAWHRREHTETLPVAIYSVRDYGLKIVRTPRGGFNNGEFVRRRGYYLKTDLNRKVHLTYRYFPTIRFRLFKHKQKIFLLCQDVFLSSGETVDCYTMYELVKDVSEDSSQEIKTEEKEEEEAEQEIKEEVIINDHSVYIQHSLDEIQ